MLFELNLCLPSGSTNNADLAAWVQALGSLFALGLTIYIYWDQNKQSNKEKRKTQCLIANHFASMSMQLLNDCAVAFNLQKPSDRIYPLFSSATRIDDLMIWSRDFNIGTYSPNELQCLITVRSAMQDLSIWIKTGEQSEVLRSQQFILDIHEKIQPELTTLLLLDKAPSTPENASHQVP